MIATQEKKPKRKKRISRSMSLLYNENHMREREKITAKTTQQNEKEGKTEEERNGVQ